MIMPTTVFSEYDRYSAVAPVRAKQWASLVCNSVFTYNLFNENFHFFRLTSDCFFADCSMQRLQAKPNKISKG